MKGTKHSVFTAHESGHSTQKGELTW